MVTISRPSILKNGHDLRRVLWIGGNLTGAAPRWLLCKGAKLPYNPIMKIRTLFATALLATALHAQSSVRGGEKRRHLRRDKAEPGSQFRESPLAGIGKDST
jgi:hypothetical protein